MMISEALKGTKQDRVRIQTSGVLFSTSGHMPKGLCTTEVLIRVHCCSVHNSEGTETASMSSNLQIDNENFVAVHQSILFVYKGN